MAKESVTRRPGDNSRGRPERARRMAASGGDGCALIRLENEDEDEEGRKEGRLQFLAEGRKDAF
jgi:hypothetical protein